MVQETVSPAISRVRLTGLPASAFQHPLDKQATENLKKIKGFDWLVSKFLEFGFERFHYVNNIAANIRVGPRQMPKVYAMLLECCEILDIPEPELYVQQGEVNAYTFGHKHPYIVLETGVLEVMSDDEIMGVIAHELGHIKCGHVLYKMMARLMSPLLELAGSSVPVVGKFLGVGIEAGLLVWDRRAELSADRASLLAMQDSKPCISMLMKLAGGTRRHVDTLDPEQFLKQARAYNEGLDQTKSDRFYRFLAAINMGDHPYSVERARILDEWVNGKDYHNILAGNFEEAVVSAPSEPICPDPNCGQPVVPDTKFCSSCGAPLRPH